MKILVTGNMGYVGPNVVRQLRSSYPQAQLVGVDAGFFSGCLTPQDFLPETRLDQQIFADVRWLDPEGRHHDKIRPFMSFCQRHSDPRVPDPYYGEMADFEEVADMLEAACRGLIASVA